MTTVNSFSRQLLVWTMQNPTQFKFQITKLPKVEYFCTSVNLPFRHSEVRQPTPFVDVLHEYNTYIFAFKYDIFGRRKFRELSRNTWMVKI